MAPAEDSLHADPDERPPPLARSIEPNRWFALFGATLLYTLMFAGLTVDYRFAPSPEPVPQEIPIEIVAEPPPPPPPPPQAQETPKPQPSAEPDYIPPAYDAPRVGKSKEKDSNTAEKSEKAPPTPDQQPQEPKTEAAAKEDAKAPDIEPPIPDEPPAPAAEGETPPPREAKASPRPPAEPPAPSAPPTVVFNSGHDPGTEVMEALTAPGRARLTYLTHLYGLILPHRRLPSGPPPRSFNPDGAVITFDVDGRGRLTYRNVAHSSGWRDFDLACLESLEKALPFPPTPHGGDMALDYHCNEKRDESQM